MNMIRTLRWVPAECCQVFAQEESLHSGQTEVCKFGAPVEKGVDPLQALAVRDNRATIGLLGALDGRSSSSALALVNLVQVLLL